MKTAQKIRAFFQKVWEKLENILSHIDGEIKHYAPLAVKACSQINEAIKTGKYDTIAALVDMVLPGDQSTYAKVIKDYLSKNLPTIISNLQLIDLLAEIDKDDIEAQYNAVYGYLTTGNKTAVNAVLLQLATDLINILSDGKFTTAERHLIVEKYYTQLKA